MDKPVFTLGSSINLPPAVTAWAESLKTGAGVYVTFYHGRAVCLLAAGECPTGGYRVTVEKPAGKNTLSYRLQAPAKDDFVIQVITYPYEVIMLEQETLPRFVYIRGRKRSEVRPVFTPRL
jgi:hypothetical protein